MFLDPTTLRPASIAEAVRSELLQGQPRSRFVAQEFVASQIERPHTAACRVGGTYDLKTIAWNARLRSEPDGRGEGR